MSLIPFPGSFAVWNVEAPELCDRKDPLRPVLIMRKVIEWLRSETRGRIFCLIEWNLHNDEFYKEVEKSGYKYFFASKAEYAPPPTKENPDGVLVLIPNAYLKNGDYVAEVMPHAVVGKAGAPWVKLTHIASKKFWVFTHLKSKLTTKESETRFEQIRKMGLILPPHYPDIDMIGLIGDLNESVAPISETGERQYQTRVLDVFKHWLYKSPCTNMKTSKDMSKGIYKGDQRQVDKSGMALSTTDWILIRGATDKAKYWIEGADPKSISTPEDWYFWYLSDHRPIFCDI